MHRIIFPLLMAFWLVAGQAQPLAAALPTARPTAAQRVVLPKSASDDLHAFEAEIEHFESPSNRLETRLFADTDDGRLDEFSPLDAALVASGVDSPEGLEHYHRSAADLVEQLRRCEGFPESPRDQVEAVFDFLHRRVLYNGYDLTCSDLRRVLDEGRFNCVSATVLFNYVAGEIGIESRGLRLPGHAMSRVLLSDGSIDVENTFPRWFALKDDPKQRSAIIARTIGAAASAGGSEGKEVSPIQMAAMIYYNRGVDLLNEKRFSDAARANAKAVRLDPQNPTARGNLLATINNWAIELGNRECFAEAVALLRKGLEMDPKFEAFSQNYVHVHRLWVDRLCGENRFEEALDILALATDQMPDRDYLRQAESLVRQRWAKAVAGSSEAGQAPPASRAAHAASAR